MTKVKANALWNNLTSDQLKALPQLQKLAEAMEDPDPKRCRENADWNEARQIMFEPRADAPPENEEKTLEEKGGTNV